MPRAKTLPLDKIPTLGKTGRPSTKPQPPKPHGGSVVEARKHRNTSQMADAKLIDMNKPLTDMQKNFVRMWASGESIQTASHRAGYSDNATYAYRMVVMPNILALYHAEKRAYEEAAGMTRKKVMDGLLEGVEMAKLAGEPASVIAGWREVGRMCGYYEAKKVTVDVNVTGSAAMQKMARMSDADLLKLITSEVESQ